MGGHKQLVTPQRIQKTTKEMKRKLTRRRKKRSLWTGKRKVTRDEASLTRSPKTKAFSPRGANSSETPGSSTDTNSKKPRSSEKVRSGKSGRRPRNTRENFRVSTPESKRE